MSEPSNQIRIQLEGRLELLEAAVRRYLALNVLLRGNWQRKAIEERKKVAEFLAEEPQLEDALEHARRLCARDGWPPGAEARQVWMRLEGLRDVIGLRVEQASWPEAVQRLRAVAESVRMPEPEELVLLEGSAARALSLWAVTLVPTILTLAIFGGLAAVGVMVSMVCLGLAVLPLGRYVLLVDRLIWVPYRGVPLELPLSTLEREGVGLEKRNAGLSIFGATTLKLPVVTSPVQLAALLLLFRDGPLKGVSRPPAGTGMIMPGSVSNAEGLALIHPGGLCFLPTGSAPRLLQRLVPTKLELPISEKFLLEQLTRLEGDALEPVLKLARDVPGGLCARPEEVTGDPVGRGAQQLRLRVGAAVLEVSLEVADFDELRTRFPWIQDDSGAAAP